MGLLVTLVCMVVLFAIGMSAMNKAVTGEGSAVEGTVRSMEDQFALYALHQSMFVHAQQNRDRFLVPSELSRARSDDTTASLFSAMVMAQYITPEKLVSANEYSGFVEVNEQYDYRAFNPGRDVHWDPAFAADLERLSHVSFAHMPLCGERLERRWQASLSRFPILGNRGPADGVEDPESYTVGRNGQWGGHIVYGDGHIEFLDTFTPGRVSFERGGQRYADNIFAVEDGMDGADAILSFTHEMTKDGAILQYD